MPADPSSPDGYSLIPVHVWTNTVADAATVARELNAKQGRYDVVSPREFVDRIVRNLHPSVRDSPREQ